MTKVLALLQARMSSTRLPGKVLAPILGEPMIVRQLERIERALTIEQVIIATSDHESDDDLVVELTRRGFRVRRGPLDDVLARFVLASADLAPSHIVRLTADCPLADPDVIDQVVTTHLATGGDYTSNVLERTYPHGLDVEVVRSEALTHLQSRPLTTAEREHVTLGVYSRPDEFRLHSVTQRADLSDLRWTVDYPGDLEFARQVYKALYPSNPAFTTSDVLAYLRAHPEVNRTAADIDT